MVAGLVQRPGVVEQRFGSAARRVGSREPRRGVAMTPRAAIQLACREGGISTLLECQGFFERAERVLLAERHLAGLAQQHPGVGIVGEPARGDARGFYRAPAIVTGAAQVYQGGVRLAEGRRGGGANGQPPIGPSRGVTLARRRAPHREPRDTRAPAIAHSLIMRKAASKLQLRMSTASAPLAGRRIVVTRARAQASELVQGLTALGAEVVCVPVIRIEPLPDLTPLRRALAVLPTYDWVVFTSTNAVDVACAEPAGFARTQVAAIGATTAAALQRRGIAVALVPEPHVAEALVAALVGRGIAGKRILVPSAERARAVLGDGLKSAGAVVDVIPVYRTVGEEGAGSELARELLSGGVDAVTFTSSSTVEHFAALVGPETAGCGRFLAAVIGPITAATARELGIAGGGLLEADPSTGDGLIAALARHYAAT